MAKNKGMISFRTRKRCMRILYQYYEKNPATPATMNSLKELGWPEKNAERIVEALGGFKYVTYEKDAAGGLHCIELTDTGRCYFETLSDNRRNTWKNIIISAIVSIILTIITTLITLRIEKCFSASNCQASQLDSIPTAQSELITGINAE